MSLFIFNQLLHTSSFLHFSFQGILAVEYDFLNRSSVNCLIYNFLDFAMFEQLWYVCLAYFSPHNPCHNASASECWPCKSTPCPNVFLPTFTRVLLIVLLLFELQTSVNVKYWSSRFLNTLCLSKKLRNIFEM